LGKSICIEQYGKFGNEPLYSIQITESSKDIISKAELTKKQLLEMLEALL
jgi:hypothetical protein